MNYAAKRQLLAGASDSEEENKKSELSSEKRPTPKRSNSKHHSTSSGISQTNGDIESSVAKLEPGTQLFEPEISLTEDINGEIILNDSDLDGDDFLRGPLDDSDGKTSTDSEIDRLINLKNIGKKREQRETALTAKKLPKLVHPKQIAIEELVNGHNGVESSDNEEPKQITEEEYLVQRNEEIKNQLLESTSEEDEMANLDSISVSSEAKDSSNCDGDSASDRDDPLDKFLASWDKAKKTDKSDSEISDIDNSGTTVQNGKTKRSRNRSSDSLSNTRKKQKLNDETSDSDSGSEVLDLSMIRTQKEKILEIEAKAISPMAEETIEDDDDEVDDVSSTSRQKSKATTEDHISLSSDSDDFENEEAKSQRRRRKILSDDQLAKTTKEAEKEEQERLDRLTQKITTNTQLSQSRAQLKNLLILDWDNSDKKNPKPVAVNEVIAQKLKPHQIEGIKFMYESCYGDINTIDKYPGSGCILAHCMGLGKTLQLIALLQTLIRYPKLKTCRVVVLCPKSTVYNWFEEFERWLIGTKKQQKEEPKLKIYCFNDTDRIEQKIDTLEKWSKSDQKRPGCLLVGYEAFRCLVNYDPNKKKLTVNENLVKKYQKIINMSLLDPGPDLLVCDEGHIIKNQKTGINKAVRQIKTRRRIILTGTPIQNNLTEYYCMVDFIKPSFLGTEKEFNNRYANPIKAGHYKDSTAQDIRNMKRRAFILHRKLNNIVQRKEASILKEFLPAKYEYVLFIPLSPCQEKLYDLFLEKFAAKSDMLQTRGGKTLLPDYTFLRKIWTHPKVLDMAWSEAIKKKNKNTAADLTKVLKKLEDGEQDEDILDTGTGN